MHQMDTIVCGANNLIRKSMTLDLDPSLLEYNNTAVLESPDLKQIKITSPEMERLILEMSNVQQHSNLASHQPHPNQPQLNSSLDSSIYNARCSSLNELPLEINNNNNSNNNSNTNSSNNSNNNGSTSNNNNNNNNNSHNNHNHHHHHNHHQHHHHHRHHHLANGGEEEEVPKVNISPSVSPIDLEEQERQKLERKRERNRIAASKCRKRKLERISGLEQKVSQLKGENENLTKSVAKLREHICHLKQEVMDHIKQGCPIIAPEHQLIV